MPLSIRTIVSVVFSKVNENRLFWQLCGYPNSMHI